MQESMNGASKNKEQSKDPLKQQQKKKLKLV